MRPSDLQQQARIPKHYRKGCTLPPHNVVGYAIVSLSPGSSAVPDTKTACCLVSDKFADCPCVAEGLCHWYKWRCAKLV